MNPPYATNRTVRNPIVIAALVLASMCALSLGRSVYAQPIAPSSNAAQLIPHSHVGVSRELILPKGQPNPLLLSSPYRHTVVHLMPTVQWVRAHSRLVDTSAGGSAAQSHAPGAAMAAESSPSTSLNLPAPACTLGTDTSVGDATPAPPSGSDGQLDSLDISAVGFATVNGNLEAQIKVVSLTDGSGGDPAVPSGQVDNWFAQWTYGGTTYYLRAQYAGGDPTTTTVYTYGQLQVTPVTTLHQPTGSASGSVDLTNNIVTIETPLSNVGTPATGATLTNAIFETDVQVGSPLYTADSLSPKLDYAIGDSSTAGTCPTPSAPAPGPVPTTGAQKNLNYFGGPIVHSIHNYLIWWLPSTGTTAYSDGSSCAEPATTSYNYEPPAYGTNNDPNYQPNDANYEGILTQYFKDLHGTAFYNLLTQYADDTTGVVNNDTAYGGQWLDQCGYTSTTCPQTGTCQTVPGGGSANPVYDLDIQNEVLRAMKINGWPDGLGNEYFVFLGFGVASCFNVTVSNPTGGACDISGVPPAFCAYHGDFIDGSGNPVLYANMTDGALQTAYSCYEPPIGTGLSPAHTVSGHTVHDYVADAEVAITSHEQFETVTDSMVGTAANYAPPLGWYSCQPSNPSVGCQSSDPQGEIGDLCAYVYGNYSQADGSNIALNGDHYIVQEEYSNWDNGCALTPYQNNGGFGGISDAVTIQQGWNLIGVPASGINDTAALVADMERPQQLPSGSIRALATYHDGHFALFVPGYSAAVPLQRTDGIFVLSTATGTWTPSGTPYTSAPVIHFSPGWNLVAPTWPNPGIMTDAMYNEIEAETNACTADDLAKNLACAPTISEVVTLSGGKYLAWTPQPADPKNQAQWPQAAGNQVPFTNGMWVLSTSSLSWTPQGTECQSVNANGVCQ